ncbi:MAG: hypothetical protein KF819_35635 [Labilithrix sp.]|nr:hypothetical protein [Labilithrix sp.]
MPGRRDPDLVSVLEAAYAVDQSEPAWLTGLLAALRPALDEGLGIAAYVYDTADRPFRIRNLTVDGCPVDDAGIAKLQDSSYDAYVRRSWIARAAMMASETPGFETHPGVLEVFNPVGIRDLMVVNCLDPIGVGCWIGAPRAALGRLDDGDRERWNRVAAHVRSSLRLRLRLATGVATEPEASGHAEAVLTRDGGVVDLRGAAEDARAALCDAVRDLGRARGELRHDPDRALPSWPALVRARWTLVEDFHADGQRYILARTNALHTKPIDRLSQRERQVVACLSMGMTNKEAAYELGLSHSTVRVLVSRASAKLGAKAREDLVAEYRRGDLDRASDPSSRSFIAR